MNQLSRIAPAAPDLVEPSHLVAIARELEVAATACKSLAARSHGEAQAQHLRRFACCRRAADLLLEIAE